MKALAATDWTISGNFLLLTSLFFTIVFLRYALLSGLYHKLLFGWLRHVFSHRMLQRRYTPGQMIREIAWSAITSLIFAVSGVLMLILWQKGYTRLYTDVFQYPLWYLPVSLMIYMLIHETYYYWLHRWMHRPDIFRKIHKVHHDSIETSSWTSFSFHPWESILQAVVIPVLLFIIPIHIFVLLALLVLMTLSAIINHAGVEVYPAGFERNPIGKWLIGAVHHDIHHKKFRYNFGLYFTFWDKWMKTESPDFESKFREKTGQTRVGDDIPSGER
ncbi:MAG: sterol desaturase family protein [Cyclobacteriaceae bacterium]|nr:sterol desaturase family protein [Cyclobacteriaceae bacterium]